MFLTKECCLTFLANPLEDLERRAIAAPSRPQPIVIVNIQANAVLPGWIDTDLTKRPSGYRRPARQGFGAHAGGTMGRDRRLRGHRGIFELGSVGLCHRHHHSRRRRIFGDGIAWENGEDSFFGSSMKSPGRAGALGSVWKGR
jgi:hypothetical protein